MTAPQRDSGHSRRLGARGAVTLAALIVLLAACAIWGPDTWDQGATPSPEAAPPTTGSPSSSPPGFPGPESTGTTTDPTRTRPGGTLRRAGTVTEDVRIEGDLELRGDRQVLRNVRVEGRLLVSGRDVTVEDSEVGALSLSGAQRFTGRRLEIFGAVGSDGIHITSDRGRVQDVVIEDSWIHSPALTDGSHYDGVQVRGVDRLTLRRNTIDLGPHDPRMTAAVFVQEANGGNTDVHIDGNWLDGGGYLLQLAGDGVRVTDNTFGRSAQYGVLYPDTRPTSWTATGNTWADSGEAVNLE